MKNDDENIRGIDSAIRNAMDRGDFDDLKGKGKPLDLNDYFETPEDIRLSYTLLKGSGYVPEEVDLLNRVSELKEAIKNESDEENKNSLKRQLTEAQLNLDIRLERLRKR